MDKFKRTTARALTEVKATPVVLVCVYNHNNTLITHDILYNVFSKFGKILRILIFEKVKVWKAFVEYTNIESAFEAKRNLNDFLLFNDGTRINVFFSNLETITFQNNNSGGVDYTQQESILNIPEIVPNFQTMPAIPNVFPRNDIPRVVEPELRAQPFPNPNLRTTDYPISPSFDDKGEDLFKIINQQNIDKELHSTDDDDKVLSDDAEKTSFNPYLFNLFKAQTSQPLPTENLAFSKQPVTTQLTPRTYEESDSFQRPVIVRHQGHKNTAPPGLGVGIYQSMNNVSQSRFIPGPIEGRKISVSSAGSYTHLTPTNYSPSKNNAQVFRPPTFSEIPRTLLNPTAPTFDPRQNRPSSFSTYAKEQGSPTRINNPSIFNPVARNMSETQPLLENGENASDNHTYQNLFDLIEKDIAMELANKMKNLEISASHQGFNQPQDVNMGYGYGEPYNPNNIPMHKNLGFSDTMDDKKSQVLYVKGLEDPNIAIHMIYNLFGNFGNILKVIFLRRKAAALLEYETAENASIAKDYLHNIILLGKPLQIYFSNFSIINIRGKGKDSSEEVLIGNPKTFRFKKNKNISINPPSATLHLSNLAQEVCNEEALTNFFSAYGTVYAIQPILKDGKHMCLVKLGSIEESINIMAILNDAEFGGRRVQLSFTRSKI